MLSGLCFSQSRNLFRIWGSRWGGCLRGVGGYVSSHCLMGKAWALTLGTSSLLLGMHCWVPVCGATAATAAPASSSSVVATNLGKKCSIIQRISLMRMSSLEWLGGCGCCSGLSFPFQTFPTRCILPYTLVWDWKSPPPQPRGWSLLLFNFYWSIYLRLHRVFVATWLFLWPQQERTTL